MASRWVQQKKVKQARMRRKWAAPYSRKNTGPLKNAMTVTLTTDREGNPVRSVTDIGIKGRAIAAKSFLRPYLLKRFKFDPNSSEAIYARTAGLHSDLSPGSQELVLAKLNQSRERAGSLQGETQFVVNIKVDKPNQYCALYISREMNFFLELRITEERGVVALRSIDYNDKHRANDAYVRNQIVWDEVEYLSPAPS